MKCPDCGGEMVRVKKGEMAGRGWECLNPDCDVIRVSTRRGYDWEEKKVVRKAIVIKGGKVK